MHGLLIVRAQQMADFMPVRMGIAPHRFACLKFFFPRAPRVFAKLRVLYYMIASAFTDHPSQSARLCLRQLRLR